VSIAYVGKSTYYAASGSATSSTVASRTYTAGNLLVVAWTGYNASFAPAVSGIVGGTGNTWSRADAIDKSTKFGLEIWYCLNCVSGAYTVAISHNTASDRCAQVLEFSGVATASAFDKTSGGTTGTSTTMNTGYTGTLSQADEVIVAAVADTEYQLSSPSANGGFTLPDTYNGQWMALLYKIVSATTSLDPSITNGYSEAFLGTNATFKAASTTKVPVFMAHHRQAWK
jgi:hypothetical protein